jgi:hypothetical protein
MLRTVKDPASRIHHHALLEDEESIQASLMEVVNALLRGTIELKRAELILRALNTAVRNIRRVKFGQNANHMVTEIPNYPTPPLEQIDEEEAIVKARAEKRAQAERAQYHASQRPAKPAASCGDGSSTRPGGPEVPGRSAAPPKPVQAEAAETTTRKPPLGVKEAPKERKNAAHSRP